MGTGRWMVGMGWDQYSRLLGWNIREKGLICHVLYHLAGCVRLSMECTHWLICILEHRTIFNAMRWDDTVRFHSYMSVCNKNFERRLRTIHTYHHSIRYIHSFIRSFVTFILYECVCACVWGINKPIRFGVSFSVENCVYKCAKEWFEWARETLGTDQMCHYWDLCAN